MAKAYKIYSLCDTCGGTGVSNDSEGGVCPGCNGKKVNLSGYSTVEYFDIPELDD